MMAMALQIHSFRGGAEGMLATAGPQTHTVMKMEMIINNDTLRIFFGKQEA